MIAAANRQRIIAKLISASYDLEDVLGQSACVAPHILPQDLRDELSLLRDDLARIIHALEEN